MQVFHAQYALLKNHCVQRLLFNCSTPKPNTNCFMTTVYNILDCTPGVDVSSFVLHIPMLWWMIINTFDIHMTIHMKMLCHSLVQMQSSTKHPSTHMEFSWFQSRHSALEWLCNFLANFAFDTKYVWRTRQLCRILARNSVQPKWIVRDPMHCHGYMPRMGIVYSLAWCHCRCPRSASDTDPNQAARFESHALRVRTSCGTGWSPLLNDQRSVYRSFVHLVHRSTAVHRHYQMRSMIYFANDRIPSSNPWWKRESFPRTMLARWVLGQGMREMCSVWYVSTGCRLTGG